MLLCGIAITFCQLNPHLDYDSCAAGYWDALQLLAQQPQLPAFKALQGTLPRLAEHGQLLVLACALAQVRSFQHNMRCYMLHHITRHCWTREKLCSNQGTSQCTARLLCNSASCLRWSLCMADWETGDNAQPSGVLAHSQRQSHLFPIISE